MGAAGASLALIILNPFGPLIDGAQSVKLPSLGKMASSSSADKVATAPSTAVNKVEKKKVAAIRKAELRSGYDLSLDSEVKKDEKAASKAVAEEKKLAAQVKKDEKKAASAAAKEDKAIAKESQVSIQLLKKKILLYIIYKSYKHCLIYSYNTIIHYIIAVLFFVHSLLLYSTRLYSTL